MDRPVALKPLARLKRLKRLTIRCDFRIWRFFPTGRIAHRQSEKIGDSDTGRRPTFRPTHRAAAAHLFSVEITDNPHHNQGVKNEVMELQNRGVRVNYKP